MKTINLSYLVRLKNQEFPEVFGTICSILERGDITEQYLVECLEIAKAKQDGLKFLKNMRTKHPLTKTIDQLTRDRHDYLLSLRGKATYGLKSPLATERNAANLLVVWLGRYHEYLKVPKTHEQSLLVDQMVNDIDTTPNLAEALNNVGMKDMFTTIIEITKDIRSVFDNRSEDKQAQSREARKVRNEAYKAMKTLINAVDVSIKLGTENSDTYVGYWNEIARLLDGFNAKVLSRSTRRKTAAEKMEGLPVEGGEVEANEDDVPEGDMETSDATPKGAVAMQSRPYSAIRLNEHIDVDLQRMEEEIEKSNALEGAMNGSGTFKNDDAEASDSGNAAKADGAVKGYTDGSGASGHSDATNEDSLNQGSGDNRSQ